MANLLIKEKVKQAVKILNDKNIDLWLTFVRESASNHDPALDVIAGFNLTWHSALCIHRSGDTTAIVGSLEVPNTTQHGIYDTVTGFVQSVKEPLLAYLDKFKPETIALNYSLNSNLADGLTHGLFITLQSMLKDTPYVDRFVSSEDIIASLRGRKAPGETELMKRAIIETERIYAEVSDFLRPGLTEKEVAQFMLGKVSERGFGLAWDPDHCPSVFTGPETAGAHSGPTDRIIERGHILNMDFGLMIDGYCSDMQRTWYVLREGETIAPPEVQRGFDVLLESIRQAKAAVKPGMQGCQIDDAARNHITANGYAEYQHGLGHQVGQAAHDGGGGFYPRWERYGTLPYLPLEVSQVYTIEPRLFVEGHGVVTMEEMIQVTEDGCVYLSHPQEELLYVK